VDRAFVAESSEGNGEPFTMEEDRPRCSQTSYCRGGLKNRTEQGSKYVSKHVALISSYWIWPWPTSTSWRSVRRSWLTSTRRSAGTLATWRASWSDSRRTLRPTWQSTRSSPYLRSGRIALITVWLWQQVANVMAASKWHHLVNE